MPLALLVLLSALLCKLGVWYWGVYSYPFSSRPDQDIFSIWNHWDAQHYLFIAEHGYSPAGISPGRFNLFSHFPPFYPMVVSLTAAAAGSSYLRAAVLVSFVCGIAATMLLASLAWHEFQDRRTAYWSSLLFVAYPVSYFLITPYSESLYLVLVLFAFRLLRMRGALLSASFVSALALLTRLMGVAITPVLLLRAAGACRSGRTLQSALALAVPAAAVAVYLALNRIIWGDWFFFLHHVQTDPTIPRTPALPLSETIRVLAHGVNGTLRADEAEWLGWGAILTAFVLCVTLVGLVKRLVPWEYSLYSLAYILFYSSYNWGISNARYSIGAFPIFFVLARLRPKYVSFFWLGIFTIGLLYFSKRFVWEFWAF